MKQYSKPLILSNKNTQKHLVPKFGTQGLPVTYLDAQIFDESIEPSPPIVETNTNAKTDHFSSELKDQVGDIMFRNHP